jgi:putative heme transporter
VAAVATVVVIRLVGRVDWGEVRAALVHLSWWQAPLLLVVLLARQVLNALPLSLYIAGVSPLRATQNDQVAILMSTIAPPPSDLALRMAMFSSWGVPVSKGMAGTLMNTLTFYIVRFGAPAVGFVLLATTGGPVGYRWADLISIAVSVSILVGLLLVVRSDALARGVGGRAGRVALSARRSVDPDAWAEAYVRFRRDVAERFRHGFPRSVLALTGMLAVDLTMLVLCLRFVGADSHEVPTIEIAIAYLFAYPFTLFPFTGLGIVDALIVAAVVEAGGLEVEAATVAALIVWRVFIVGGPLAFGAVALGAWRGEQARK